ncbi:hypothetical protein BSKO_04839 [Bryopsis sp. KO-2023]|nr:hypothetical protein BSKO_04839 [Bryopsis sp. KO-2023]
MGRWVFLDENEASREERRLAPPLQQASDGADVGASSIPNDDVQDNSGVRDVNNDGLDVNNDDGGSHHDVMDVHNDGLDMHNDGGGEVDNDVLDIHNDDGGGDNDGDLRGDGGLPAVDGSESDGSPGMDTEEETEVEEDDGEENSSETTNDSDDSSVHNEDTDSDSVENDGPDFFGDVHHNEELKTPLYPGCVFTLLHVIMLLLQQKADHGTTREAFEANLKLISAILPPNHVLPTSLLRIKRLLGVPHLEDVTYFSCETGCKFYHVKDRRFLRPSLDILCEYCRKPIFTVQKGVSTALEPCLKIFYFGVKSLLHDMCKEESMKTSFHYPLLIISGPKEPKTLQAILGLIVRDFKALMPGNGFLHTDSWTFHEGSPARERVEHSAIISSVAGDSPWMAKVMNDLGLTARNACPDCFGPTQSVQGTSTKTQRYLGYKSPVLLSDGDVELMRMVGRRGKVGVEYVIRVRGGFNGVDLHSCVVYGRVCHVM